MVLVAYINKISKKWSRKGRRYDMSKEIEKVFVTYDEMFCDELSVDILYENKGNINGYEDNKGNVLTKKEVVNWVLEKYYSRKIYIEWCECGRIQNPQGADKLYLQNIEYRKLVEEERIYILFLLEVEVTKIADIFGVSRPTVYKKIESFERKWFNR